MACEMLVCYQSLGSAGPILCFPSGQKRGSGSSGRGTFARANVAKFCESKNICAHAGTPGGTHTSLTFNECTPQRTPELPPVSNWVEIGLGFATRGLFQH